MDVVRISHNRVDGFVRTVHGIDQEVAKHFDADTRSMLGIGSLPRLGRVGTLRRVRLMPDGCVESAT